MRMVLAMVVVFLGVGCGSDAYDPAGEASIEFVCVVDMDQERRTGRVAADESPADVMAETAAVVDERIAGYGLERYEVRVLDDHRLSIHISRSERTGRALVEKMLSARGHVQFRLEVLPREHLHLSRGDSPNPKTLPWPGTEAAFDAYKREEVARWQASRKDGTSYTRGKPELYVIPRRGKAESREPADWVVIQTPGPDGGLDARHLRTPTVGANPATGEPVLLYEVAPEYQERLKVWTGRIVGLPMALILDGELLLSPIVNEPLSKNVQISLGHQGSREERHELAKRLADAVASGALRVVVTIESERETGR